MEIDSRQGAPLDMAEPVYLDYQATTPLAPEALSAMTPWLEGGFANPHSSHSAGRKAAAAIEAARSHISGLLPDQGDLIFTSGATEAINLGLRGTLAALDGKRHKIVTVVTEHAAVRDTCFWLGKQGYELILLPVGHDGLVDLEQARETIDEETAIVAVMLVNNEIGVIQPVADLADIAHDKGALFLCDAVQGYGRVPIPANADMVALSAHKIHGPKGIGALWRREGIELEPLLHGGGQEAGVRSGTLSPALCAGFGAAAKLADVRMAQDDAHVVKLWRKAREIFGNWEINGSVDHRYKGNLNIRRDGLDVARLMSDVREVSFSAGSACASGSGRPSHVLTGLGLESRQVKSSIRIGFGRYTSEKELSEAAFKLNNAAKDIMGTR